MRSKTYQNRKRKQRTKKAYPRPFKSSLEYLVSQKLNGMYKYEPKEYIQKYTTEAKYHPDFVNEDEDWLLVEVKGRFMGGSREASKYIWVMKSNPGKRIFFIFENPSIKAYPSCKIRKDGTYLTLAEWAAKNNFAFCKASNIPKALIEGKVSREWYDGILKTQREAYLGKT